MKNDNMKETLFPTYKEFLNEKISNKTADILMQYEDKIWSRLKITSGSDLYSDMNKQKKYVEAMKTAIELGGLADDIMRDSKNIYDALEDENYHTVNAFLVLGDYIADRKMKNNYIKYAKENPDSWLQPF